MLGFRPTTRKPQDQSQSKNSINQATRLQRQRSFQRQRSSSPLPIIYEPHGSESQSDASTRESHSSSSSSSSCEYAVVWPPHPGWPHREEDELPHSNSSSGGWRFRSLGRHDNGGIPSCRAHLSHQPLLRRQPYVSAYGSTDDVVLYSDDSSEEGARPRRDSSSSSDEGASPRKNNSTLSSPPRLGRLSNLFHFFSKPDQDEMRSLKYMESDVTTVHSNCHDDIHHNFNSNQTSWSNNNRDEGPFGHLLIRHDRHRTYAVRIWQSLSILVMMVFVGSLLVMPSVLEKQSIRHSKGEVHNVNTINSVGGESNFNTSHEQENKHEEETEHWYPKPWKYLFGKGNDEEDDESSGDEVDSVGDAVSVDSGTTATSPPETTQQDTAKQEPVEIVSQQSNGAAPLIDPNISFASLASIMLPTYFQTTLELCKSTILPNHSEKKSKSNKLSYLDGETTTVTPDAVFELRKQMLKTRDLLDVFSTVYPPIPQRNGHKGDLGFETRDVMWAMDEELNLTLESDQKRHSKRHREKQRGVLGRHRGRYREERSSEERRHREHDTRENEGADLWKTIRKFLDGGYTIIGDFQDLDHANIDYTPEQLADYQKVVWQWHVGFVTFAERNYLDIMRYLSYPCPKEEESNSKSGKRRKESRPLPQPCQYSHSHSSHLFWGGTRRKDLPDGNQVRARVALGRLGNEQLERAQMYLNMLWTKESVISKADVDEPIEKEMASRHDNGKQRKSTDGLDAPVKEKEDENVHEVYHNLRKELRSFLDEVDVFGTLLVPDTMVQPELIVLGELTDDPLTDATATAKEGSRRLMDANETVTEDPTAPSQPDPSESESNGPHAVNPGQEIDVGVAGEEVIGPQVSPPLTPNPPLSQLSTESSMQKTFDSLAALRQTRKLLGDLNDDYTAYTKYVEWNTNFGDQVRLMIKIEAEWNHFRWWAAQIDLNGQIDYLRSRMAVNTPPQVEEDDESSSAEAATDGVVSPTEDVEVVKNLGNIRTRPTEEVSITIDINCFLKDRKEHPTSHIIVGNDAGDADSIVSAVTLAFIEQATPIVSIPKQSFVNERPETNLLFRLAGIQAAADELLFIEDLILMNSDAASRLDFTLIDHNVLNHVLDRFKDKANVIEILDHHEDERQYLETCSGDDRTVAFDQGVALVASSCTLVAERLKKLSDNSDPVYPESIGTLLLGVILIDSVNMDESVGKVTQRDRDAVNNLIEHTDWSFSESKSYIVVDNNGTVTVDTNALFEVLQRAKYETSFWSAIPVDRALAYDYKEFKSLGLRLYNEVGDRRTFGIASVLMPGDAFILKDGFASKTKKFMATNQISFLSIMFAFYDSGSDTLQRQLTFCADQSIHLESLIKLMLSSEVYEYAELNLEERATMQETEGIQIFLFDQHNVKPSRKQIGPMLEVVYESYLLSY